MMKLIQEQIVPGLVHYSFNGTLEGYQQRIHIVRFEQGVNPDLVLIPSKASAAIVPGSGDRSVHRGEEATFQQILEKQVAIRMMVNGVFHHFSKTKYDASKYTTNFQRGDNVHEASYRGFRVGEPIPLEQNRFRYALLTQKKPGFPFALQSSSEVARERELPFYTITCSPMLIWNSIPCSSGDIFLDEEMVAPSIAAGTVLPPGNLSHLHARHPRTMIAATAKNELLFITVDGPPKYEADPAHSSPAVGMNWTEQVRFLQGVSLYDPTLTVKHAANMDGGGSTTLYLHDGKNGAIRNQPSDPGRAIGNTLILFDHSLLAGETREISSEHREQIERGHAKHLAGFEEATRTTKDTTPSN